MSAEPGPSVDPATGTVTFVVDEDAGVTPAHLWYHLRDFGDDPAFHPRGGHWVATLPPPPVDRLEYRIVVREDDGTEAMLLDPRNPRQAPGVFGANSLLELPGYRPPEWLGTASPAWGPEPITVTTAVEGVVVQGDLLTPPGAGPDDLLPLLVAHDGPEYARLARLLDYLWWLGTDNPRLRCRALLLQPADRDLSYAASATYTDALVDQALPRARALAPTVGPVVGLGASLGALALAHAAATRPGTFGGLLCQSGSFFLPRFDAHEQRFRYYDRVVAAVADLHAAPATLDGVTVALTAGLGEENLENNRALAERLRALGVDADIVEGRDGHNYTAWRDLLHPTLKSLLGGLWSDPAE